MTLTTYERAQLAGDQFEADIAAMFGKEIETLATWINRAPESVDVEAIYESIRENHTFDTTDDGLGENDQYIRDCFESWSPRLRAARVVREAA